MSTPRLLNLALQGGGAHGAFTWGVLDALLEDGRIAVDGLSGTSAGAMNAVVLAHGWQVGGRYRIITGNPDTPVTGSRYLANFDAYLPIYGPINSLRLPTFHQLDVRIDRTWTFDAWMLDAYVDVLNAYNHRSIEGSVYSYDFSQHAYFEGLPVIPTLGVKGSF